MPQVDVPDTPRAERAKAAAIDMLLERCRNDLARLDPGVRRVLGPHRDHVSLSPALAELRAATVRGAREEAD